MKPQKFLKGAVALYSGDCREVLKSLPDNSIDSVSTDPPYALVSITKRFANSPRNERPENTENPFGRTGRGFMGQRWDTGETAFSEEFWAEVLRVLKPGGHVAAFGATRGYHRMACAIEDAGFEIRDSLAWLYGVGFPKSHNISNNENFCQCGAEQATECNMRPMRCDDVSPPEHAGAECGQVLQPGVSQCSSQSVRAEQSERVAGIAQSVVEGRCNVPPPTRQLRAGEVRSLPAGVEGDGASGRLCDGTSVGYGSQDWSCIDTDGMRTSSGSQAVAQRRNESRTVAGQPFSQDGGAWENCGRCGKPMVPEGLGTALKPAFEPIVLARKPLSEPTVAANVLRWGTGALNIDGCRVGTDTVGWGGARGGSDDSTQSKGRNYRLGAGEARPVEGRWPANVVHDGSAEVADAFPVTESGSRRAGEYDGMGYGGVGSWKMPAVDGDVGSAARFFYRAKADTDDRIGSKHPTVKPVDLIQWVTRLITPPGGTTLDPFAGTGTTGEAAFREGFKAVLIERDEEYQECIRRRMRLVLSGPDERRRESIKAKMKDKPIDAGPLFGGT